MEQQRQIEHHIFTVPSMPFFTYSFFALGGPVSLSGCHIPKLIRKFHEIWMKDDEMGGKCSRHERGEILIQNFLRKT